MPEKSRICVEPNAQFSNILCYTIIKKYNKISLQNIFKEYGAGILLVGTSTPFSCAEKLSKAEKLKILSAIKSKVPIFEEIYLYDGSGTSSAFFKIL